MNRPLTFLSFLALLAACSGGNPLYTEEAADPTTPTDSSVASLIGLAGTTDPSPSSSIFRYGDDSGDFEDTQSEHNAHVSSFSLNGDELTVCCLAFDGDPAADGSSVYAIGTAVSSMGGYSVYQAEVSTPDFLTTDAIAQITPYRAIMGVSDTLVNGVPRSQFVIVQTGGYIGYGFGGFAYMREGSVILPTTGGEATFSGSYAGMRTYEPTGRLDYTTGDMEVAIDFGGFGNETQAIRGIISNYQVFDINGNLINDANDPYNFNSPYFQFVIDHGDHVDDSGEITGDVLTNVSRPNVPDGIDGNGTYYGILSGDLTGGDGGELVGVLAIEWGDLIPSDPVTAPDTLDISVSETGGFILTRTWP